MNLFNKLKEKLTKSYTDPIDKYPKERKKVKYLHFFLGLFSFIGIIWTANINLTLEIPTTNDFISRQYTLKEFRVKGGRHTTYNIYTKEYCGKFSLGRGFLSNLHKKRFVRNVQPGDTFTCKIKKSDAEKLFECNSIKLWEITTPKDTFLYISDMIDSEIDEKSFFAPIVFFVSFSASLYFFYGFYIIKNYKRKRKK